MLSLMKKISLKNITDQLSKSEQLQLMAGSGDVNNHNTVSCCSCSYNNNSATNNTNDVTACTCNCI